MGGLGQDWCCQTLCKFQSCHQLLSEPKKISRVLRVRLPQGSLELPQEMTTTLTKALSNLCAMGRKCLKNVALGCTGAGNMIFPFPPSFKLRIFSLAVYPPCIPFPLSESVPRDASLPQSLFINPSSPHENSSKNTEQSNRVFMG